MAISDRRRSGVTLIELMIACGLTALIVTAVLGVYVYALQLWERGQAESGTYTTASLGIERICKVLEQGTYAETDAYGNLKIWAPRDKETGGDYLPYWESNAEFRYRTGDEVIFYLSNHTGSSSATGDILWKRVNGCPDTGWSMFPNSKQGRVSPIRSLSLQVVYVSGTCRLVQVTLTAQQKRGSEMESLTLKRYVYLRNHN